MVKKLINSNSADIRKREKEKARLMEQGLTIKQATAQESQQRQAARDAANPIKQAEKKIIQQKADEQAKAAAVPNDVIQQQIAAQAQQKQAIEGLGQSVNPNVNLNQGDPITTSALSIPAIAGGAATGAGIGAAVGSVVPILGTAVGAAVGGVIGGLTALSGKIALDKHQATKEAFGVYKTAAGTRNTQLLNIANSGTAPPADIMNAYNQNLANIRESRDALRELTKGKIGNQLSGAMDELNQVESYLDNEPFYRAQLAAAIANPKPGVIYPDGEQDLNTDAASLLNE